MIDISFKDLPLGPYTEDMVNTQWKGAVSIKGVKEGRCSIVDVDGEHVLQVTFAKGKLGPTDGGASWRYRFDRAYDEFNVEYKVRVGKEFEYVRGGKLPGLCGGDNPRGGMRDKEAGGFSARVMWRELGALMQYVYSVDEADTSRRYGKDMLWTSKENRQVFITKEMWKNMDKPVVGRKYLTPDVWHTFKTYIKMNTVGQDNGKQEDGQIISWFNGEEVLNVKLRLRKNDSFCIDSFQFVTYFGGNDETWFPKKDEKIYFKDFRFTI
jgi:hypothetical protein